MGSGPLPALNQSVVGCGVPHNEFKLNKTIQDYIAGSEGGARGVRRKRLDLKTQDMEVITHVRLENDHIALAARSTARKSTVDPRDIGSTVGT